MLQKWSHIHYSHNSNIKCVDLTIKCIDFHYAIDFNVLSFKVFSDFDYMFLTKYC